MHGHPLQPVEWCRQALQAHDEGLISDRDFNAARTLTAMGLAWVVPLCCLQRNQLEQLTRCMDPAVRRAFLEYVKQLQEQHDVGQRCVCRQE